jgi:CHAT domain-containing protein/tetratricopeptide (TPR) repeat protein
MPSDSPLAGLQLSPDVLRENDPDPKRVLLWLKEDRQDRFQHWTRVSGHLLGAQAAVPGLAALRVRVTPFRQKVGTDLATIFSRFWGSKSGADAGYILPTGEWAELSGQPREDALLVWTSDGEGPKQAANINEVWPGKEACKQLGPSLFLILGVAGQTAPTLRPASANGATNTPASAPSPEPASDQQTELTSSDAPPGASPAQPVPRSGLSDRDVQQWLQRMSRQVSQHCDAGQWPMAVDLAQQVLGWTRKQRGEEHSQVAACLNQVGRVYQLQGDHVSAEPFYREALRMNGQLLGITHPSFALGLNNLALLHQSLGNLAGAEELHRQSLEIRLASLGERHPLVATSQNNFALMHLAAGNPKAAEPLIGRAVESLRAALGPEHPDLAICLNNQAAVCRALGDAAQAGQLAEQARRIREVARGRDYLRIAESLNILADFGDLGDQSQPAGTPPARIPDTALDIGKEPILIESTRELKDKEPIPLELALEKEESAPLESIPTQEEVELVLLEAASAREEEEPVLLEAALLLNAETADQPGLAVPAAEVPPPSGTAPADPELSGLDIQAAPEMWDARTAEKAGAAANEHDVTGEIPAQTGDHLPAEASSSAEDEDTDYWQDLVGLEDKAEELVDIAEIDSSSSSAEAGASAQAEAIDLAPVVEPPAALPAEEKLPSQDREAVTSPSDLIRLADQHRAVRDYQAAEPLYRRALDSGRSAWDESQPYFAQLAHAQSGLALTCAATGRADEALALLRRVLAVDAGLLADALAPGNEERLPIRLYWLRTDLNVTLSLVGQYLTQSPEAVRAALDLVLRYKGLEPESRAASREALRQENNVKAAGFHEVAQTLPRDGALVEFVRIPVFDFEPASERVEDLWKPARYLAFVMAAAEPDDVRLVDLGDAEAIDGMIAGFRASITGEGDGPAPPAPRRATIPHLASPTLDANLGRELREAIFDPLTRALGGRICLFLAPAGNLACLPFEVLPTEEDGYVLDTYQISYLTCGREVLRFGSAADDAPSAPVVAGDPDFDLGLPAHSLPQGMTAPAPGSWRVDPRHVPTSFPRLPGTRRGTKAVAELLQVAPLLAGSVRKTSLQSMQSPRILHLATHCYFSGDEPSRTAAEPAEPEARPESAESGLVLAGANRQGRGQVLPALGSQGFLSAPEIAALDLAATELVVLPSCAAGPGTGQVGEKLLGLRRAFVRAGARTLVMSQWKSPDWHTKVLLADFYDRLLAGEPLAEALRSAQLALRAQYPDQPVGWGAFICQGDPGPLDRRTKAGKKR